MTDFTHSLALVIGINGYSYGIRPLTTPVNDAMRLAELLEQDHGYEVHLLVEDATKARMEALFAELRSQVGQDDRVLVYFAGHGVALDGDDGPRGYLVPQDARSDDPNSLLAMTDLNDWLAELPCRHMLAILDCCFAGAFRWAATRRVTILPPVIHKERYDRYLVSPAWQALTSAAYNQAALDIISGNAVGSRGVVEVDGRPHSPFALALFDALKGEGDLVPKGDGDGVITATELYLYLREQVEVQAEAQASHEQTPGLWPLNKHRNGEFIFLVPGHELNLPPAPELTYDLNPWRGLKSYEQRNRDLFFGRDQEIEDLVQLVSEESFTAVLGASGTGKSSLVKAGLLPRLRTGDKATGRQGEGMMEEGEEEQGAWEILPVVRPGVAPLQVLNAVLRAESGEGLPGLTGDALARWIESWVQSHPGRRLVLTIDQFEELVTLSREQERERFLALLAEAIKQHPNAFRLIVTLRTDFEPQFTREGSPLAEVWQEGRYVVPPMTHDDLRQVIEGPASVRVLYFDPPELVEDLIEEVIQTPGALPLLSFTLSEMYIKYLDRRSDAQAQGDQLERSLTKRDYAELGGVIGSLRHRANQEYEGLPDDAHRETMERVMLRMVAVEGGELARRRVALSELVYPTAQENDRVRAVLECLVGGRLLVSGTTEPVAGSGQDSNGANGEPYVEPAHDALVLAWDRLLRWKKEAEEYLPLQRRLAQAATEWNNAPDETRSGLLWDDDPRLPQLEETLWPTDGRQKGLRGRVRWTRQVLTPRTDAPPDTKWLNGPELAFVQSSARERARFWQRVVGTATLLVLVLVSATVISLGLRGRAVRAEATAVAEATRALNAQGTAEAEATRALNAEATAVANEQLAEERRVEAEREARRARAGELSAVAQGLLDDDPELALLVAREALMVTRTFESEEALRQALRESLLRAAYAPDDVWFDSIAFAPDGGRLLAWGDRDGQPVAHILHMPSLELATELRDPPGRFIQDVAFSPNGEQALTVSDSGAVSLWDLRTGVADPPFQGDAAGWSADGTRFVVASGGTVDIRDAAGGRGQLAFTVPAGQQAEAVYFAAGDALIVLVTSDGFDLTHQAQVLDATGGEILAAFPVNRGSLSFTADRMMLAHGDDLLVEVRAADDAFAQPLHSIAGHREDVSATRFSPDDRQVATVATDGAVRVWNLERTGAPLSRAFVEQSTQQETTVEGAARLIEFSPVDGMLLTAGYGRVRGWDIEDTQELLSVSNDSGLQFDGLAVSPDGRHFATATEGGLQLWRSRKGEEYALYDPGQAVMAPDGRRLALVSQAGIRLQAAGPEDSAAVPLPGWEAGSYRDPVFTDNGRYLYAQQAVRTVWWDATTGESAGSLDLDGMANGNITLEPDGTALGGSMRLPGDEPRLVPVLLDAATGQPRSLAGDMPPFQDIKQLGFSSDGAHFLVNGPTVINEAGGNRVVRVWETATGRLLLPRAGAADAQDGFPADGRFGRGTSFIFSPDSRQLIMANEDGITIWAVPDGARLAHFPAGDTPISAVAMSVSAAGDRLVVPDGFTTTARVWDLATGAAMPLRGHPGVIDTVRISADGSLVLTASGHDGSTRLWDGITGEQLTVFPWRMQSVNLSADGRLVLFSPGAFETSASAQLYVTRPTDLLELSRSRVTRVLTCPERRSYLREAIDCLVVTPEPVAD